MRTSSALGRMLDERVAAWNVFAPTDRDACAAQKAALDENEGALRRAHATGDRAAWWREWKRVAGDHDDAIGRSNALAETVDAPAEAITGDVPRTLAGLAVQARAVAWAFTPLTFEPPDEPDYDEAALSKLLTSIAALAG